ncbi:membrane-spanning 4-domains subfamily A member 4A-like isoform 1-T1 [Clarias gariepinus]
MGVTWRTVTITDYKSRGALKMTSASLPLTNMEGGLTIVTKVVPSLTVPAATEQNLSQTQSQLQNFLKGEPKALGVVQIMIGVLTILFGIVLAILAGNPSVYSGVVFWSSLFHIIAGSLAVSASNKLHVCVVKAALGLNIFSTIAAGIAIIMLSLDFVFGSYPYSCSYHNYNYGCSYYYSSMSKGISGVLIVFSVLQFAISIAVSAFTCKAFCPNQPTLNTITVIPNSASGVLMVSSIPTYQAQPVTTINNVSMSSPPVVNLPAYHEKGEVHN